MIGCRLPRVSRVLLILVLGSAALADGQPAPSLRPLVVLVSIDGWRWDYIEKFAPPTIGRLARDGVRSEGLVPVFPSKTFPNHYTIVTGLYPGRHGIISNNMVDPALPGRFTLSNRDVQQDTRWWGGEPIWVTAERQGQVTATMFWPGSDVEIAGRRPTFWQPYEHDTPSEARIDRVLQWLDRPDPSRPTFVTLYFSIVDSAGHEFGPESNETRNAALEVDRAIARLLAGLDRLDIAGRSNVILVSDHGMSALSPARTILLDDYLDMTTVDMVDFSPVVGLNPRSTTTEALYAALKGKHPSMAVYTKSDLPEVYGLRDHPRLPSVIGVADDGWRIVTRATRDKEDAWDVGGNHGFDPRHRSMNGLFVARGSAFRQGHVVEPFENVHLYELMCRILGLRPAWNDGDADVTAGMLVSKSTQ